MSAPLPPARTVVAPLDGTPEGERALPLAALAARRLGAALELFHVVAPLPALAVDPPLIAPTADGETLARARGAARAEAVRYVDAVCARLPADPPARAREV
ncbi:universal stress protein, partial [Roseisolibacter sp. H3M3-2]|uniref:universal stress protein n=1 Tax=Roseisolibacter sp. H3M3-2 TaxID=3031323 RepID=UPI0023D9C70D